jgi:hypothetical protein
MVMSDPIIKLYAERLREGKIDSGDRETEEAFASLNWEQQNAIYTLLHMIVDTNLLLLLTLTSRKFGPFSLVYRSQANEAGIRGIADAFVHDGPQKLIDWMAEYSEFPYKGATWSRKYGFPGNPEDSMN